MYPEGIKAMAEAVNLVAQDKAPKIVQPEEGATYDAFMNKAELCKATLDQPAKKIHDFIRGLDSSPGA
jgi:formyltetrahydrofolate dehydrogenase